MDIRVVREEGELRDLLRALEEKATEVLSVSTNQGTYLVRAGDVALCRAEGHRFLVYLRSGAVLRSKTTRQSFGKNIEPLVRTGRFLRTGSASLVNINEIAVIRDGYALLNNGEQVRFSHRWQQRAEASGQYAILGKAQG